MLFLTFTLGADRYALDATAIVEVLPLVGIKRVPHAPAGVAGLMNYRGTAVPVVDLSALCLGVPASPAVSTRLILVRYPTARGESRVLGLIAERATDLVRREPGEFGPPPVDAPGARYLGPVATDARGVIQRVDVTALLREDVRAVLFTDVAEV